MIDFYGGHARRRSASRTARVAILCAALAGGGVALAAPDHGYLADASIETDLDYKVPPAPDNRSEIGRLDLAMVEMAQTTDAARYDEAFRDASAYAFDQLMGRFSAAAGTDLSPNTRPILAHVLERVLNDTAAYATQAKASRDRARPYVEDPRIVPCETDHLRPTDNQSYPSGHATNGYAAALLLAEVMPSRAQALLARGIRYGDNRVVCGVHHPIDVEQGRFLAIAVFAKLRASRTFADDVACARQEHERSVAGTTPGAPFRDRCVAMAARYQAEFTRPAQAAPSPSTGAASPERRIKRPS